jgi:deoxyribonucleoside regulator
MITLESRRTTQLVEASRLYYVHGLSQERIASKLGISRPSVSRLLQSARDKGIVRIEIRDPLTRGSQIEDELREKFGLAKAIVVPNENEADGVIKNRLGNAAVLHLDELISEGKTLGISWGTTMQQVASNLRPKAIKDMIAVQLNGGISRAEFDTHASEIAQKIGSNYGAIPYLLPLPAVVDTARLKKAIVSDRNIARTLDLARNAEIAMFTIGSFGHDSVLVKADYFEKSEVDQLLAQGAIGDICSRILDQQGSICSPELDSRTIGIELKELRKKPHSIAVAGGKEKLSAIKAGLNGKWFNTLITDEWVASELIRDE